LPGPENAAVGGSSLGGLISLYTALSYPKVFGLAAAFSPSVWFSKSELLAHIAGAADAAGGRFYLDTGTKEGEDPAARVEDTRGAAEALRRAGVTVELVVEEGAGHNEAAWARRFPGAAAWLFPGGRR
jgi:predicted alpha/beta superfamily hydrolase